MTCGVCDSPHHYLLHGLVETESAVPSSRSNTHQQTLVASHSVSESTFASSFHSVNENGNGGVVLGTARIHVADNSNQYLDCRAILDSGAQNSFITLKCAQRLGLLRKKCSFTICGLGGTVVRNYGVISCTIRSHYTDVPVFVVDMVVVGEVCAELPNVLFSQEVINQYKSFQLADPHFYKQSQIDILLGNDILSELIIDKPVVVNKNVPHVIETTFGFILSGRLRHAGTHGTEVLKLAVTTLSCEDNSLDKTLREFWEIEEVTSQPSLNPSDLLAEEIFIRDHYRDKSGRYVVPLPFVTSPSPLGESRSIAERRLIQTERRLNRSPQLREAYNSFMKEYEELDHMELYTSDDPVTYFIPHHSILRPSSTSTPLRVVFDGSAKTSNSVSLNDILLTGAKLYRDIVTITLNFRLFEFCFSSDICKMYRGILVRECDRTYQNVLYRHAPNEVIKTYQLKTITYGLSCSPFLAIRTLLQLANDEGERFPTAAQVLREGIYMDDILWSCETFSQACELQDELINILGSAGLVLKKWSSNNAELLMRVPEDTRECPITFIKDEQDFTIKVLGLQWTPSTDTYHFNFNKIDTESTKRSVLKILASIYDPIGFIAPCTFVAKCIMQDLWKLGLGWDEHLPIEVAERWLVYIAELSRIAELRIERHALQSQSEYELVGFCDASSRGYAACVYVISRNPRNSSVKVRLLLAKSKVAPIKPVTIPRLELMGAVLLSKLIKVLNNNLKRITIGQILALTDSSIVLGWLQTDAFKLKTFVSNRVSQVIDVIPSHSWRHINSENNMADLCSRGVSPSQFLDFKEIWLNGPRWLYSSKHEWPISSCFNKDRAILELKENCNTFNLFIQSTKPTEPVTEFCERLFNQFSSYSKLQRTVARILKLRNRHLTDANSLSTKDLFSAHDSIIKLIQSTYFHDEIKQLQRGSNYIFSLRKLSPFLDERGFLRVGGRISNSQLPYNAKHPLLLPKDCKFNKLLIEHFHKKYLHVGPRTLHNIINQRYWIVNARSNIRSVLSKCIVCFKNKPRPIQPLMGSLPTARITPNKVFEHTGVDIGGPWLIKESLRRNAKVYKAYLCLFICFSTKAVHLEVLSSLSADCFLATLDRFVSRRGLCSHLYSDCGTNFVAASEYLNEVQNFLLNDHLKNEISTGCYNRQIHWHFNPPSAPHMGGLWEAGIKSAKYHLIRAVGDKALTFEELSTIFCKIEAILNSRPLCALSNDPNEFDALTAGHFLIGRCDLSALPENSLDDVQLNRLSRWQYIQSSTQLFWKRWSKEYLNSLQQREKWSNSTPNLKIGDLVLIKVDQIASCRWPLARVEQLHPGSDGVVRCVTLRTQKGLFKRPVNKCSPLPYKD